MSSWSTFLKIQNNFNAELNDAQAHLTSGKLSGKLPSPINAQGGTENIQVNAENGDSICLVNIALTGTDYA